MKLQESVITQTSGANKPDNERGLAHVPRIQIDDHFRQKVPIREHNSRQRPNDHFALAEGGQHVRVVVEVDVADHCSCNHEQ